jgi:hypothetical protein
MTLKFNFTILILMFFSLLTVAQTNVFKRYKIKSAIVEYELSGNQTGTATLYFDNFGMQEATYESSVLEIYGDSQQLETVSYLLGFWQYTLDVEAGTGTKTKNTVLESLVMNSDGDLEQLGLKMFRSMGGELSGTEEMLGKTCDVWELKSMGTKIWVWKNIPLKSVTEMMGLNIIRTAISLQENVVIPAEKLEIPSEIDFMEIGL